MLDAACSTTSSRDTEPEESGSIIFVHNRADGLHRFSKDKTLGFVWKMTQLTARGFLFHFSTDLLFSDLLTPQKNWQLQLHYTAGAGGRRLFQ